MPDVPIIGSNGSGSAKSPTQRQYTAQLTTVTGNTHFIHMKFGLPVDGHGRPDLAALKDFDPKRQAYQAISNAIANPAAISVEDIDGNQVVWGQIVTFRFVGAVDE